MPRFALKIEYNGQGFHGWQRQQGLPSVQGALELALSALERDLPGLVAAGRTDTGVHGLAQVAHCDMHKDWICERLKAALNFHIRPHHISIIDCVEVAPDWHARFSAVGRDYLFRLVCRSAPVTLDVGRVWQTRHDLDIPAMREAVKYLLGTHDFTTFRSTMCQANSPIKTLDAIDITERDYSNGKEVQFHVQAKSFLHNQVRSLVGTLERVGAKSWSPERVKNALEALDRAACGPVCPPDGLYLKNVRYPQDPFAR